MASVTTPLVILARNAVTTWDCFNQSEDPFTFYPQQDMPLADVAWNHNGQVLVTCSAVSTDEQVHNNVVLTAAKSGTLLDSLQHNQQWQRPAGVTTSLAFGGKSRYLCIGDQSGAVCLWDLKKKVRVRQFFHEGQASHQVSLDPTDTYVLSLTSRALHSYKLREGIPAMTWTPQSDYSFTSYASSTLEPQTTAVGTDDGSLMLYDITNPQKSVPFFGLSRRHKGPVTGVAFSHTSDKLLASASSDGVLQFFDTKSGSLIEQLAKLSEGISSLALHVDGVSCAVGTNEGGVVLFDLRQAGHALASMYVEGSVTSLQFSPPPKHNKAGAGSNTSYKKSTTPPTLRNVQNSSPQQLQVDTLRRDLEQVTSEKAVESHRPFPSQQPQVPTPLQEKQNTPPTNVFAPSYSNLVLQSSAVSDPQHNTSSYLGPEKGTTEDADGDGNPNNAGSPQKSLAQQMVSTYGGVAPLQPLSPTRISQQHLSPNLYINQLKSKQPPPSPQSQPKQKPTTPSSSHHRPSPKHQLQQPNPKSCEEEKGTQAATTAQLPTLALDVEEIRHVVRDEVEKLQDDLEESLRNLHMDMIRQFHQQSQELNNALSSQLAATDQLREENQRLREENEFLKQHQPRQQLQPPNHHHRKPSLGATDMLFGH